MMSATPYNCEEHCQAPDSFFSGSPWLSSPSDGTLDLLEGREGFMEWKIWVGQKNASQLLNLTLTINGDSMNF